MSMESTVQTISTRLLEMSRELGAQLPVIKKEGERSLLVSVRRIAQDLLGIISEMAATNDFLSYYNDPTRSQLRNILRAYGSLLRHSLSDAQIISDQRVVQFSRRFDDVLPDVLIAIFRGDAYKTIPPVVIDRHLPELLRWDEIIVYLFEKPAFFGDVEDSRLYEIYLYTLLSRMNVILRKNVMTPKWLSLVRGYVHFSPLYSLEHVSESLLKLRGGFVELSTTRINQVSLNWKPAYRERENKYKVVLVVRTLDDSTENFTACAILKDLVESDSFVVEILAFSSQVGEGAFINVARSCCTVKKFDTTDAASLKRLRDENYDLAIFVSNLTWGCHPYIDLAIQRIATVQAAYYTSVISTCFRNIDIWLSSEQSEGEPSREMPNYCERFIEIGTRIVKFDLYEPDRSLLLTPRHSRRKSIVSGANIHKMSPRLIEAWADLLSKLPDYELCLYPFNPHWADIYYLSDIERLLAKHFLPRSVSLDRVEIWGPTLTLKDLHARIGDCRLYLDSFPHSGGLSTLDGLLSGVPAVCLAGDTQRGYQSADIFQSLSLHDLVTRDVDAYIERTLELCQNDDAWLAAYQNVISADYSSVFAGYNGVLAQSLLKLLKNTHDN